MSSEDHRVKLKSKKYVCDQLEKYRELLTKVLDGQSQISDETKKLLLQELLQNFDTGVQESVVINGESWEDAPDEQEDAACKTLDDMMDENILETTLKRKHYPKKILPYVVRSLRAEREAMVMFELHQNWGKWGLYEQAVKPQEIKKDPVQGAVMNSLTESMPGSVRQVIAVIKSLQALERKAEGLRHILAMQRSMESLEIHRQVFGKELGAKVPSVHRHLEGSTLILKRNLLEVEMNEAYVLNPKRPCS